jgi:hypothetical protein
VTDHANHAVEDIRQEEIQLVDDRLPQTISFFSKDIRPVDYAVVIDNSGSFRDLIKPVIESGGLVTS